MEQSTVARAQAIWRWGGVALSMIMVITFLGTVVAKRPALSTPPSQRIFGEPPYVGITPTPLPQPVDPNVAWGSSYPTATFNPVLSGNARFYSTDVLPNASGVVGNYYDGVTSQAVAIATIAQPKPRILYTFPSDMSPPAPCTDGRYVAWVGGETGEAAPSSHQIVGYTDLQTGRITKLLSVYDDSVASSCLIDHGALIWGRVTPANTEQLFMTDLAQGRTTRLPVIGFPQAWRWPNLLVIEPLDGQDGLQMVHEYDVTTKTDAPIMSTQPGAEIPQGNPCTLTETKILCVTLSGQSSANGFLYSLVSLSGPNVGPLQEAQFTALNQPGLRANDRLFVINEAGSPNFIEAWDETLQCFVTLVAQQRALTMTAVLNGNALALVDGYNNIVILVDTSRLP